MDLYEGKRQRPHNIGGMSAAEIQDELNKAREAEAAEKKAEKSERKKQKKAEKTTSYKEYLDRVRRDKEKRFRWQKKLQRKNLRWREERLKQREAEKRKKEEEADGSKEQAISYKDTDPTATQKGLSNVVNAASQLGKLGVKALLRKRKNNKNNEIQQVEVKDVTEPRANLKSGTPPLLPSSRTTSSLPPSPPPGLPPAGSTSSNSQMPGWKKREAINKGTYLGRGQVSETYSCWREEFIYELASLRQKSRKRKDEDKPIDIMRGKNNGRIKLNPNVMEVHDYLNLNETTNGASIFAKATPPMKRRTTPLSDIHLAKQPGKKSVKQFADDIRKLFLGDRAGYYSNYDLSGHASDDNSVDSNKSIKSESYNVKSIALSNQKKRRGF